MTTSHFNQDEWLGFIEFLFAPFDPLADTNENKPWAYKRFKSGQDKAYSEEFEKIRFEIGNETWNRLFSPWVFPTMTDSVTKNIYSPAEVYGLYQNYVLSIFQSSPYWNDIKQKLVPIIGGWTISSFGEIAAQKSPLTPLVTVAEYNGGWDQGEGVVKDTDAGYSSLLSFASQTAEARALSHIKSALNVSRQRGTSLDVGTYEAGPGYVRNGLNNAKVSDEQYQIQEQVMKSVASGTATLDTFLIQLRAGYVTQNFFMFKEGDYWSSHAKWYRGGHPYPAWQWLEVINNGGDGPGDLLKTRSRNVPAQNVAQLGRRKAKYDMPLFDVYPFIKNNVLTIVVISRMTGATSKKFDGSTNIVINMPKGNWAPLKMLEMNGDYRTTNVFRYNAKITESKIRDYDYRGTLTVKSMPDGEARVYTFKRN